MNKRTETLLAVILAAAAVVALVYNVLIHPHFVMPRLDETFLQSAPTQDQVIARFGKPVETIAKGDIFRQTGWHPCPDTPAVGTAQSFVRGNGDKIYIFFDDQGRLKTFVRGRS